MCSLPVPADVRAFAFYDQVNTGFYVDPSSTNDSIRVAGNIVAYYSDERLKDIEGNIDRFENIYKEMIIYSELFTIIFF